jgi:hypothetical protein
MSIFGYDNIGDMFDGGGPGASNKDSDGNVISYDNDNDPNNAVSGIAAISNTLTGNSHANDGYGDENSSGITSNYVTSNPNNTNSNSPAGTAPEGIMNALGFLSPIGIFGKLGGWANGLDPKKDIEKGSIVDGRQVYVSSDGMQYSYNFLGMPYQVEVVGDTVQDFLKKDANGKYPGDEGYDPSTTGYKKMAQTARDNGDEDTARAIEEEAANNDGEILDTTVRDNADKIIEMATAAGVVASQEEAKAIIADPMGFLAERNLKVADLIPTLNANAEGTSINANDPNYNIGDDFGYTATTVNMNDMDTVDPIKAKAGTTYNAAQNNITPDMEAQAATGQIDNDNLVNADEYTLDMKGSATGYNEDGSINYTGQALNEYASQGMSQVIDTRTVSGKLLAQNLGEGNYIDSKATMTGQLDILADQFVDQNGNPKIPSWAAGQARAVFRTIAFNGMTGSAATAALSTALMEASLPIAQQDAEFFKTLTITNLDNRQQAIINKATVLSKFDVSNLTARENAAVQNAKAFLEMDLTNLTNEQQAEIVNKQAMIDALFENTSAENAARRFGAETANEMAKFYDELMVTIQRHNSSELNAMRKANMGEINDAAQFTADIKNDRDQFVAELQYKIDLANAKWRQTVETENFRAEVDAYTTDVKNGIDITTEQQAAVWDSADNLLNHIWKTTDNGDERELRLLIAQMQAQSGQQGGSGFMEGLLTLGGAFLGTSTGAKGAIDFLKSLSDVRLKENIQHYDTLKGINFYTWDWNAEGKRIGADKYPTFGVLAQEVQKTHPEAVVEGPDGYLMVNYGMISNDV